jgi:hypothetical protein
MGNINRRITVQDCLGTNLRLYLKIPKSKKGWGHGSRVKHLPSKPVQGPGFKTPHLQKKGGILHTTLQMELLTLL